MKSYNYLIVFTLICTQLYAQNNKLFLPQGFMLESLSGYGYSKTINDVSNINSMNPAALSSFNSTAIGISYQFDTEIKEAYPLNVGYSKNSMALPQSFGMVYAFSRLKLGLAMSQRFNASPVLPGIALTPVDNPAAYRIIYPEYNYNLSCYSFISSYSVPDLFGKGDKFSLGLNVGLDVFSTDEKFDLVETQGYLYGVEFTPGILYNFSTENIWQGGIGLFYAKGPEVSGFIPMKYNFGSAVITTGGQRQDSYYPMTSVTQVLAKGPDRINIGAEIAHSNLPLRFTGNLCYVLWNQVSESKADKAELSGSFIYDAAGMSTYSLGFVTVPYENPGADLFSHGSNEFNAVYITAGAVLRYRMFDISLALADSHLFSGDWRRQTVGKAGLVIHM